MSSIQTTAKGYRAQVAIKGLRDSATFTTKREAQQWAARREVELRAEGTEEVSKKTLSEAFKRYGEEVSPTHRGWRWEHLRIAAFERSVLPCKLQMSMIQSAHISAWRDERLAKVGPGTVLREVVLLSAVFEAARRDWLWIKSNPVTDMRKPAAPKHRERLISRSEIKQMLRSLGYCPGKPIKSITQSIAVSFVASLRTGMRAGELAGLEWDRYHGNHIRLEVTKTDARNVPLSSKARRLFERMRGFDKVPVFGIDHRSRDVLFRRARDRAGLSGFTFHDARHTAATWIGLSGKLELLEMCKMFGWKDPKHALIYFNPTVSDLANKLG